MSDTELDWGRRFCDVVMKGGITSGVVYPSAIAELATKYELRNIGGASAGAIASTGAAAAEYRRQTETDPAKKFAGFDRLRGLADELGQPGQQSGPHSRLFHLFLPSKQAQPIFSILTRVLNLKSVIARLIWGIAGLFMAFPLPALVGLSIGALTLSVVWHGGTAIALPLVLPTALSAWQPAFNGFTFLLAVFFTVAFTLVLAIALCVWRALRRFAKVMAAQDFGLCTGMRAADQAAEPPALTEWLYALFQDIAGKPHAAPLTFGDLRAVDFAGVAGVEKQDGIVLRVMTTCLTGGRPYTLPFEHNTHFFFDPDELGRYFPKDVIEWMKAASLKASDHAAAALGVDEETEIAKTLVANELHGKLIELPPADDLPVILAVRLSLSFPILLSALPLYRESLRKLPGNPQAPAPKWERYMERVLFTDGGVCSNLPVHMFDAPLPAWPTFAINLRSDFQAEDPNEPPSARAVRPRRGQGFRGDRYPIRREATLGAVASFLTAIVSTMQNWRDVLQRSAPGSRDRVVTVRHTEEEGGLNLDMPDAAIKLMAASGTLAAQKLIDDFHAEPGPADLDDAWTYHRWVRLRNLLRVLPEYLHRVSGAYTSLHNHPVITELLDRSQHYVAHSYRMDKENADAANVLLDKLSRLIDEVEALKPDFEKGSPNPKGDLRIAPRF